MSKATKKEKEAIDTYIISVSDYQGDEPTMFRFRGTFRALLVKLIADEDSEELDELSNRSLIDEFNDANGDGQPYYQVYCLTNDRVILG